MRKGKTLWAGTNGPEGIYVLQKEELRWRELVHGGPACASYLIPGPGGLVLAAVETEIFEGSAGGAVVSCRLKGDNIQVCGCAKGLAKGICHLTYVPGRRLVFAASYPEGSIDVLKLEQDGQMTIKTRLLCSGSGSHPKQTSSHAHCCAATEKEDILYVCDLGTDEIVRYDLETLRPLRPVALPPGSGPRHMVFGKDEDYLYIACELSNHILVVRASDGAVLQSLCCRPKQEGFCALSSIRFTSDKKNLILGCRGIDGIWSVPLLETGLLGEPAFFASASSFPWDVLPLDANTFAAAFTQSDCVEIGCCQEGRWKSLDSCRVQRPTCLLC